MRFPILVAGLLAAGAAMASSPEKAPSGISPGAKAPAFSVDDANGRTVTVPPPGRPALLFLMGRATADATRAIAARVHPLHPDVLIVNVIDLRAIPKLLRNYARSRVAAKHDEAFKASQESWRAAGKEPPADLSEQIHLLPDFDGSILLPYGADEAGKHAHVVLVGTSGDVRAVWTTPPDPQAVLDAF